ncbi:MAG: tRNA pseudouridine(38-40) synthase TruA [Thiotrichaceae bacterium]
MKFVACIEYNGTSYCGWQRLGHAKSVQEEVETALSKVANQLIEVTCAGRTDSGVHALGQIIHFDTEVERLPKSWMFGANTHLPNDIAVLWVKEVPKATEATKEFSARFSAHLRRYRYVILNRKARSALLDKQVSWIYDPLDERAMNTAAQALIGEHDFSSFQASSCQSNHAIREIKEINVSRDGVYIYIDIAANAFLHHMVRNIVGSLVMVGKGAWDVEFMAELLALKDRKKAGPTARACGLYFVHVHYPKAYEMPEAYRLPVF